MRLALSLVVVALLSSSTLGQANLRAWSEHGQTWIVWEETAALGGLDHFEVYRSTAPITDVSLATLTGRIYPQDGKAARLQFSTPGATWRIPDGTAAATPYVLAANEHVLAYTPHGPAAEYFAVVQNGTVIPPAGATVGPVAPLPGTPRPHPQAFGIDGGHPYTVYALWVEGAEDETSGLPGFPILGNASTNGIAHLFAVFEPTIGLPPAPMPAVVFLHGGGGNYWRYRPSTSATKLIDLHVQNGLYVTVDDNVFRRIGSSAASQVMPIITRWFGYARRWDRFAPSDVPPPADEVIVNYTQRLLIWIFDWLVANQGVDTMRISVGGLSNGGLGVGELARSHPGRIASGLAFVLPSIAPDDPLAYSFFGSAAQNLATSLGPGYFDFYSLATEVSVAHLPFLRIVDGTQDASVPWLEKPPLYDAVNALRWGAHLYWDARGHTAGSPAGWAGHHWVTSPRHSVSALTQYRADRSFPALHDVDHDLVLAGAQPDPGDAVIPANGDPWGTWGGYFDWNTPTMVDTADEWAVSLGLVTSSTFANDIPPVLSATASVTIRRPQAFTPDPLEPLPWSLSNASTGALVASGSVVTGADGLVTIPNLTFGAAQLRLRVWRSVQPYGAGTAGCIGVPTLEPQGPLHLGDPAYELAGVNGPISGFGVIAVSDAPFDLAVAGITLLVDPSVIAASLSVASDSFGASLVVTALPSAPALAGRTFYGQTLWLDPCGAAGLTASGGVAMTLVQ